MKNYWNTYIRRKIHHNKDNNVNKQQIKEAESAMKPHEVIKPVPRALPKTSTILLQGKLISSSKVDVSESGANSSGSTNWWETLLLDDDKEDNVANNNTCFFGAQDINRAFDLWDEDLTSIVYDFHTEGEN